MGKPLIVVESPAKAATIQKYLQGEYDVEASAGHVKDLPEGSLGVDVQKDFEPRFVVMKGKKRILDHLRKKASQAPAVFLAPDPDREGEAIAAHIAEEVRKVTPRVVRVLFHEITRDAVRKALESPREVDQRMVHSQLARRILDRLVGYQISPILWKKVQGGLSAGRVQSVAVRLVVDRASANGDHSLCKDLQDDAAVQQCTELVLTQAALKERRLEACNKIPQADPRNRCRMQVLPQVAADQEQPDLCKELQPETHAAACRDQVHQQMAMKKQDLALCDRIESAHTQRTCRDYVNLQKAYQNRDASLCDQVKEPTLADNCRKTLQAGAPQN